LAASRSGGRPAGVHSARDERVEVTILPDGAALAVGGANPVLLRSRRSGEGLARHEEFPPGVALWESSRGRFPVLRPEPGLPLSAFGLLPEGSLVAERFYGKVEVWTVGGKLPVFREQGLRVVALAFTPDGRHLVGACDGQALVVWETGTWRMRERFDWDIGWARCLAISPDGLMAAASGYCGEIVLWDLDF
jgi:WD40 repeat protein